MLWIALHLPQLPLDARLRCRFDPVSGQQDSPAGIPIAIGDNKRIGWCNAFAEEAGICPGMSESNAHALVGQLQLLPRDLHAESQALHEAALWTLHFTPSVALRPAGLLIEVSASLRLFNGASSIASQLLAGCAELGLHARLASATTATGAWLLAQCAETNDIFEQDLVRALDPLPVAVLESVQPYLATLEGIGCRTLGQLRRLPRAGLARRFDRAVLLELDRAYGKEAEAHAWFEAPASFTARIELPARVEDTQALLFATRRMLLQMTGWLTARHAAALTITLGLHHESRRKRDHRSTSLTIALSMPSRDLEHLTLLLRERLAQLELPAAVIELTLQTDQIVQQATPNTELFPTPASDAESTGRLIERLQSRLGPAAVHRLTMVDDHRPEKSTAMPIVVSEHNKRWRETTVRETVRPTWLLPQPLALATRQHKPVYQGPLTLLSGPERIESGWWDDALATRDYFVAQNAQHQLLWIYRVRTLQESADSGWFLHGFFG